MIREHYNGSIFFTNEKEHIEVTQNWQNYSLSLLEQDKQNSKKLIHTISHKWKESCNFSIRNKKTLQYFSTTKIVLIFSLLHRTATSYWVIDFCMAQGNHCDQLAWPPL